VVGLTRKSSVGAVIAAAALPTLAFAFDEGGRWVALTLALGVLLRHRPNLERLWRGAELGL
jgi:glycerol-3-phosphate acyltransferase PlsY